MLANILTAHINFFEGGTSNLEMGILSHELFEACKDRSWKLRAFFNGAFMTALEMAGVSVTVLKGADDDIIKYLDLNVGAPGWSPKTALPPHFWEGLGEVRSIEGPMVKQQAKGIVIVVVKVSVANWYSQPFLRKTQFFEDEYVSGQQVLYQNWQRNTMRQV